ncbi:MAG: hypothetical protein IPM57_01225 [Oligoflexia bacterium]|nr:hypothetical protein [Oligoflexia bacterium]
MGEIVRDFVDKDVFFKMNYATSCEDCAHFDSSTVKCTFGYPTAPHLKEQQLHDVKTTGMVAFCRTQEID